MTRSVYSPSAGKNIEVEELDTGVKPKNRSDRHIGCPVSWLLRILPAVNTKKQLVVAIWLWRWRIVTKSPGTFTVPNGELERWGISRFIKYRTLALLVAAGVIAIERRGKETLTVTVLPESKRRPRTNRYAPRVSGRARHQTREAPWVAAGISGKSVEDQENSLPPGWKWEHGRPLCPGPPNRPWIGVGAGDQYEMAAGAVLEAWRKRIRSSGR